ncbi:MAG: hypothetical protein K2N21_05935 [Rikenellaceae bacterium]|nr:hypothetical protein [Rikenellaceae bacterium]
MKNCPEIDSRFFSSRGVCHFPVSFEKEHNQVRHSDHQSSGYDNETCDWSNTPDIDLHMDEQLWVLVRFVWTGPSYRLEV